MHASAQHSLWKNATPQQNLLRAMQFNIIAFAVWAGSQPWAPSAASCVPVQQQRGKNCLVHTVFWCTKKGKAMRKQGHTLPTGVEHPLSCRVTRKLKTLMPVRSTVSGCTPATVDLRASSKHHMCRYMQNTVRTSATREPKS